MDLYNAVIKKIEEAVGTDAPQRFEYDHSKCWPESEEFELIMSRDGAYELGGSSLPTANCTCITSDETLVGCDEILVYGKDLNEITEDVPYARIAMLRVGKNFGDVNAADDSKAADGDKTSDGGKAVKNADAKDAVFRAIQDIDFVKYHVFPKGFMARTSALSNNEQVRISKDAVRDGISFQCIGNTFIRHYKDNPNVLNVRIIFVTSDCADYKELRRCAKNVTDITKTLSKIMEGMPTDCHTCNLKPVCDEVEGMRELHFGKAKKQ